MRFASSIFGQLLEPINRRQFETIVARHDADAYDKSFRSWEHLVALIFAQFSAADSLRGLEAGFNANSQHHYHLGCGSLSRSTLSDANVRRPVAVFAETFTLVAGQLDRRTRRDGNAMLRLIDSTPVPLGKLCDWARSNGRIRGMKMHVVYDPHADRPRVIDIADANVNDAQIGRTIEIEPATTYVFDKGYCHFGWWRAIDAAAALFVTRPKKNMRLRAFRRRPLETTQADGLTILEDAEVRLVSKGDSKLPIPLRRIKLKRDTGETLTLLTNDRQRSALQIAALYKGRWQIELLFRWIKQHLNIRKFLGNNDNAIRLQLFAAMITYALIRIAAQTHHVTMPIQRFTELIVRCLLERRKIATINKPPPVNPGRKKDRSSKHQLSFKYA